jgi:hypothetical protein
MKRVLFFAGLCFFAAFQIAFADLDNSVRRFGLFVGANNGGGGRVNLRYAVSDARSIAGIFSRMGGIEDEDRVLLIEPSAGEIERNLAVLQNKILEAKKSAKRTELVFYYSGHSDEDGLLLNRQKYSYRDLRNHINSLAADMRIVILDSCASGAFTRLKGGVKTSPFLMDDSVSVEGYAFLTSSSATESSQESDLIAGSYFTHSLLSGLRGAADTAGDGRVTLNELYRFAYNETLIKTETSLYGAQHPSYDMQISGTGDVVLTDVKEISAGLIFEDDVTGRLTIRDSSDFLIAELTKVQNKTLEIGLEPGLYRIVLQRGDSFFRAEVLLSGGRRGSLSLKNFSPLAPSSAVSRGDDAAGGAEGEEAYHVQAFKFQLIPDMWLGRQGEKTLNGVLFGLIGADGWDLHGVGLSAIGISNYRNVRGLQIGGIYATAEGDVRGLQIAGIFSYAGRETTGFRISGILGIGKDLSGGQLSGIANIGSGGVEGFQAAGITNINAGGVKGFQGAGISNINAGGVKGFQGAGIFNFSGGGMEGAQVAGIVNWTAGSLNGLQLGLVNLSGEGGTGVQIGLVNLSANHRVIPIGLVNVIKGGILNPSVWLDSMGFMNLSLKSGSKYFYSHLSTGLRGIPLGDARLTIMDGNDENMFITRIGLGGEIPLGKLFIDIEALCGSIIEAGIFGKDENMRESTLLIQGRLIGGFKFFIHLAVFGGISYDYLLPFDSRSPVPSGGLNLGGNDKHRIGFFGGMQF